MSERGRGWIQLYSGKRFYPADPRPEDFDLEDIAIGLARKPRFSGMTERPIYVAQHAVVVSYAVPPEDALEGLHHDDDEALPCGGDIPRPVKKLPEFAALVGLQRLAWLVIAEKFGLRVELPESVHLADQMSCVAEATAQFPPDRLAAWDFSWVDERAYDMPIDLHAFDEPWSSDRAAAEFIRRHHELRRIREGLQCRKSA